MRFLAPLRDSMLMLLGAAMSAYVSFATAKVYAPKEVVVIIVGLIGFLMGAVAVHSTLKFSERSEALIEKLRVELHAVTEALGRPAEFFPKELPIDDGRYYIEIARYIDKTQRGETVFIVTDHSAIPPTNRKDPVDDARRKYHEALEEAAGHRGVILRRIVCMQHEITSQAIATYFSPHFIDHCRRMLEIARTDSARFSLRTSRSFAGIDALVIPGRVAAVTADARDPTGELRQVLCWLFFSPPNGEVIDTLEQWCIGIDNTATPLDPAIFNAAPVTPATAPPPPVALVGC